MGAAMTEPSMPLRLRYAAHTDRGLVRRENLDAAWAGDGLLAVADGFGPPGSTSVVSAFAIEAMATAPAPQPGALMDGVRLAAQRAADAVRELISSDSALDGAGTTLTALAWSGSELALVHVGDTRAYLLRGGDLLQLTHDDTLVQSLIDKGELTDQQARFDPRRATLIRALHGGDNTPPSVLPQYDPQPGDRYLLCSDGLHAVLSPFVIRDTLLRWADPEAVVNELIVLVHRAGAPDNVACVVADLVAATH
jgi:serine/threonine protein phosphatase PrpC